VRVCVCVCVCVFVCVCMYVCVSLSLFLYVSLSGAHLKLKGAGPVTGRVELRAILCQRACRKREGAHRLSDEFMGPTGCCIAKAEICDVNNIRLAIYITNQDSRRNRRTKANTGVVHGHHIALCRCTVVRALCWQQKHNHKVHKRARIRTPQTRLSIKSIISIVPF